MIYDKYSVIHYVKFSGSKGFHFITPFSEFDFIDLPIYDFERESKIKNFKMFLQEFPIKNDDKRMDIVTLFKVIAYRIKSLYVLDTLDTSVQDIKRVCKTAYSLDDKSGLVTYPLDDEQFLNFDKSLVAPENVIRYNNHKRGLLWRNTDVPKNKRVKSLKQMLVDLGIFERV